MSKKNRGVQDGTGPEGRGATGIRQGACGDELEYKMKKEGKYIEDNTKMTINPEQLAMGIKIEMEHTKDKKIARQIALDHLAEDSKYYSKEGSHMEKSRYTRRTGGPGNYKYEYGDEKGTGTSRAMSSSDRQKTKTFKDKLDSAIDKLEWLRESNADESALKSQRSKVRVLNNQVNKLLKKYKLKKSQREGNIMNESRIALVIIPGSEGLEKAAKLSKVGSKHPAGTSTVHGKTKSRISYTGHVERMKLAKMAAARMLAPKPEDENEHTNNPNVDQGGRVKGGKPPYNEYGTGVSGMGSQAHDNFGRKTIIVKPSEIGTSTPESPTAHTPIKEVRKPKK